MFALSFEGKVELTEAHFLAKFKDYFHFGVNERNTSLFDKDDSKLIKE